MTYIRARQVGDGVEVDGSSAAALGHVVDRRSGDGVHARWHVERSGLTVENDPLGFWPTFYREIPDGIVVSDDVSELIEVAEIPTDLDVQAAATMLESGELIGEETLFSDVRTIPPNSVLRWDARGVRITQGEMRSAEREPPASRDEAIDLYIDLFRAAVARRLPDGGRAALLLSGGEDSRHILLELCRQGARPDLTYTAAIDRRDPDLRAARLIARETGVEHIATPHPIASLALEREANRRTSYCANELAWMLPTLERIRSTATTAYDGIGGDVLSAGLFLTPRRVTLARTGEWLELVRDLAGSGPSERVRDRFVPHAVRGRLPAREETLRRLADDLSQHAEAPNPVGSWMFATRTRRQISMQPHALLSALRVQTPFLDLDLVRFLRSLPAAWLVDRRLHREVIRRAFPATASVPFEDELATSWDEVRRGLRRRISALRLVLAASEAWSTPTAELLRSVPHPRSKAFLSVRRALTVHHAAELCDQVTSEVRASSRKR